MSPAPIPEHEQEEPEKNCDQSLDVEYLETPDFNIAAGSSSDTDDNDEPENQGYQLLPQDAGPGAGSGASDNECNDNPEEENGGVAPPTGRTVEEQVVAGSMELEGVGGPAAPCEVRKYLKKNVS